MEDLLVSESLVIQSHRGPYTVAFDDEIFAHFHSVGTDTHFIVDARVAEIYSEPLANVIAGSSVLLIQATEKSKSLDRFTGYVEHLVSKGIRRGHVLIAIGGGVIQDITCFLAATLLRGIEWRFYPTTLLAQADSCIGSKSSINVASAKNV